MHTHQVVMLGYPDAQILDITGPLEVFSRTSRWLVDHDHVAHPAYQVEIAAELPGPFSTSCGVELIASRGFDDPRPIDTLLVTGGLGFRQAGDKESVLDWLRDRSRSVTRLGSICTGSIILARAGLLDHQIATTHWAYCEELARAGEDVSVDADAIYVRNGALYTSAGVTAGMDMALAMVEEDWGQAVALAVAQELVMYLKRPGGQSQFSNHLRAQNIDSDRLQKLQLWILDHLSDDLTVRLMAKKAAMSERTFARRFVEAAGITPAKFVEQARVQAARRRLEESALPIETIAARCGFGSTETLRRSFLRELGVAPSAYRDRFRSSA
jgi:transcriptional regulator GlxA family with amidase domain